MLTAMEFLSTLVELLIQWQNGKVGFLRNQLMLQVSTQNIQEIWSYKRKISIHSAWHCLNDLFINSISFFLLIFRREALYIWKRKFGSDATYQRLISVFEQADFQNCAEMVKSIVCEDENEVDDSSDYDEPIPQPDTYPNVQSNPLPSPKFSKCVSYDEYFQINPATASNIPKGIFIIP